MSNFNGSNWYSNNALLAIDQIYIPRQPAPSKQHDRNPKKKPVGQITVAVTSIQLEVNTRPDIFISSSSPTKRQRLMTPPSTPSRRTHRPFSASVSAGEDVIEIGDGHHPEAHVSLGGNQPRTNAIDFSTNARGGTSEKERMSSEHQATEDGERPRKAPDVTEKSSGPATSIESSSNIFGTASMVEFYVGPEEQLFAIHETALARVPNLYHQFRPYDRTSLPHIEPATFHHLVLYLYSGAVSPTLPETLQAKDRQGKMAERNIILKLYALAVEHELEELANKLIDNLRANRKLVRFFPHELVWLAENSPPDGLMLGSALQQLAFDVRRKGLEQYRLRHPRDFTVFFDCKEEYKKLFGKKGLDCVREQDPSKMENCKWHIHMQSAKCRENDVKQGVKRGSSIES